ncbi:MAG TPA: hypothetical protein VE035_13970 [Puia sp.]|nr:hypothetical protein [Puia sp.]
MKNPYRNSLPSVTYSLVVAAVKLDLFARMMFMGRRKKSRYLARTFFQQAPRRSR